MSLVPEYEDSDDESNQANSISESESPDVENVSHQQIHANKNDDSKKESLPSASFLFSGESKPGAVFNNPFKAAENAKIASLEKHVKMVSTDDKIKTINGKKICWNYRKGRCRFGSKCKFAHDSDIQMSNDGGKGQSDHLVDLTTNQITEIPINGASIAVTSEVDLDSMRKKRNKKRSGLNSCIIPNKQTIRIYSDASNMNEGESAGGRLGQNPALPAVLDRRSISSGLTQMASGSAVSVASSMSLLSSEKNNSQQTHQFQIGTPSRISYQQQIFYQTSANNLNNSNNSSNNNSVANNSIKTESVVTSSGVENLNSLTIHMLSTSTTSPTAVSTNVTSYSTNIKSEQDLTVVSSPNKQQPKRIKLEGAITADDSSGSGLKKRILEHKYHRLKNIKEKYTEHVTELYFLQTGGSMMDYPLWRKKAHTPQFVNFMRSYKLDQTFFEDSNASGNNIQPPAVLNTATTSANLPHGTEIKIPGVGVTPVAVSTQLPAAVAQLSQQGNVPGRPQGGRHGMVFGQISTSSSSIGNSSLPLVPGGTPLLLEPAINNTICDNKIGISTFDLPTGSATSTTGITLKTTTVSATSISTKNGSNENIPTNVASNNNGNASVSGSGSNTTNSSSGQEQFSAKARQEVYVMQRVTELQREGLWTEKRLPKIQEPTRPKAHWDYLLEEMVWLAADFAQERKWKKSAAKKCARMVQKYFQDRALAAQKAEKAQELHLKRIAAYVAKEIKIFWANVEKLVEIKQQTKLEEKRKKALDQHLSFIVDQTEKFSQQLTEGMNKSSVDVSGAPSLNSSRKSSPKPGGGHVSDDEFSPGNASSDDDEETIAKAEAEQTEVNEEVAALQRESEMDLDDFLKELPKDYLENRDKINLSETEENSDEEFQANADSDDDENTIKEQEEAEKEANHEQEIRELNAENNMSIEDLMEKYKNSSKETKADEGSADESTVDEESEAEESDEDVDDSEMDVDSSTAESENEETQDSDLKNLLGGDTSKDGSIENKDDLINDAAALAESIQPKGNTLSSTNVVTPVPFLLKHSLREYQHIGLDWLVTMHDRKLNGILADEMGLGKTIQTIALLGHLACVNGNWGPHLIIVPSSVMLNWEMEFKKWCPGFKILTYYGTQKERKIKRIGWTKPNTFHVCITSYKLVIQDHQSFRRKKWKYLILDEAQNIKNFKSQRWQLLLNFQTDQRLLLTGTPLQNNLMELWSLMHFLMPHVFQSHREFKEWFSNPMTGMIEGNSEYNDSIIKRLHKVLRPFLLRRLKSEVEKQMPKKYEHIIMCRLSKRQRFLYDDFMSRAKTRETLSSGNLLSVINVLMQLRKVCNHPNLFEIRPTISPFEMDGISYRTVALVWNLLDYNPFKHIDLHSLNLVLLHLEMYMSAYVAYRVKKIITPRKLIEEIDTVSDLPPKCPSGKLKFHVRIRDTRVQDSLIHNAVKFGTSPAMKSDGTKFIPLKKLITITPTVSTPSAGHTIITSSTNPPPLATTTQQINLRKRNEITGTRMNVSAGGHVAQIVQTSSGRHILLTSTNAGTVLTPSGQRLTVLKNVSQTNRSPQHNLIGKPIMKVSPILTQHNSTPMQTISQPLATAIVNEWKSTNTLERSTTNSTVEPVVIKVEENEFLLVEKETLRKERRAQKLQMINNINHRRCDASPIYGSDLRESLTTLLKPCTNETYTNWFSRSYTNCYATMLNCDKNWSLSKILKSYEERTHELNSVFNNFVLFVPAVSAPIIKLHVTHPHPSKVNDEKQLEFTARVNVSPKLKLLHPIISAMSTQFPDPRLIQYDCGKLQTLDKLLRNLKYEGHRVLIFTQMTRMLDVLEAFLNYHGHIYLRLDGTTKIEQRQLYMERFNGDKRIFVFILSTRSGGVGINLTGADTVIFYDSDWNPTMDAQAQDRCHRIGQTRDVHIYRLISEKTIEENILKKANQKRLLGDMAIEGGNFTTAYFKSSTIQDIFNVDNNEEDANMRLGEVIEQSRERKILQETSAAAIASISQSTLSEDKNQINVFENALAAAEDEQDVQAATSAKAEAAADLDEFDETIPIEEAAITTENRAPELSKAEQEVENIIKQLSPIERYAMRFVEETGGSWTAEQLRLAEAEIENQKREWEANRLAALQKEEEAKRNEEDQEMITYSSEDAKNQIWISHNSMEKMPMWCPPTPPQDENDVYRDYALSFLYETIEIIPETQLPPVYVKKELKRNRNEAGFFSDGRRPVKIRKEETYFPPRSLFDKPSPALAKIRRELKIQRYRGNFKPMIQIPGLKQQLPMKPLVDPEGMLEWFIYEDMAILNVIQNLQGLPLNLMLLSPGQTPNWDLVSDIVNQTSRTYRSPKQCRYRYEAVIVPREEGKLMESPKKQKKNKNPLKIPSPLKGVRSLRTSQLYHSDSNSSFTKFVRLKFDNIKTAYMKKAPQLKQLLVNPSLKNPKHAAVLSEFGIGNYESPMSPLDLALRRVERINKDKQKASAQVVEQNVQQQAQPQLQLATIQGNQSNTPQQATAIVVQTSVTGTPLLVQSSPIQVTRHTSGVIPQQSQHLVKALVTSSGNVQHIVNVSQASQSQIQQLANQQSQGQPTSVSVVLTGTTVSSLQQSQLVSIQSPNIVSSSGNVSQTGSIVQTMTSQSLPQVVSVSQLQNVGAVITSSALGTNVGTMSPSIRAQRIVGPGGISEVVLNRSGSQSPTVVSVSGLGQGITQNQLQATQLRFQVSSGQQISGVVTKGISVGQGVGKPSNTPQIQIIRPQLRQQFKILQPTLGQATGTVVQSAGGQTTLVSPGTLIQSGLVQQGGNLQTVQVQQSTGQKVQLVSAANTVTVTNPIVGQTNVVGSVATVQVAPGQTRTQFIKHIGPNKQAPRQLNSSESVQALIKHQILNQQKPQVIPQSQIQFAPGMPGSSGQQQIATLVKTSSGNLTTLQQMKSGQIKATMANQSQVRQIQLQQQQPYALQNRKGGKMTQFAQVAGKAGMQTQLIVQNPKALTGTVTMQQIQHVIRHAPPGTITTGQIVLGKPGRVIPVSVASQSNQRPIQVVTASAAQALAAGNLRTHLVGTQNASGTIKVAASAAQVHQQQQALLTAFQNQRQNSNQQLRLQTTSAPLVAVTVQQQPSVQVTMPSVQQNNTSDNIQTVQNQKSQNQ